MSQDHAIVIGASMAGLLSARMLSDRFHRVTLIDRDELPETPANRQGVPQADIFIHCWFEESKSCPASFLAWFAIW